MTSCGFTEERYGSCTDVPGSRVRERAPMIFRWSWPAVGRTICAGLRAIAGPVMPVGAAVAVDPTPLTAADVDEFVRDLEAGLIDASHFGG